MLNVEHFAGSGVWHVAGRPTVWSIGAPRNASQCDKSAIFEVGRKFFSRGLNDTAACDRDVTIYFARSKRKGEKEC
ncbi:MAG TPA: hypothetical protein VHR27_22130, partial [Blastocatellia bacterium]|nr:hypothetical protein [Blastocatellia bacterium]